MNYSLLRESRVVIRYEGRAYEFDALSNVSANLDYQEYKSTRKTLHKKRNYPVSRTTAINTTDISLAVNLTDNLLEVNFFKWLGLETAGNFLFLPEVSKLEPTYFDVYIISQGTILCGKTCYVSAVDFTLEKSVPLLNIAIEGAYLEEVHDYPTTGSLVQGNVLTYSPIRVNINNNELPAVMGAGLSFQQQCTWRDQRSLHNIGRMYSHKKAYTNEMNSSATINFNYVNTFSNNYVLNELPETDIPVSIFNSHLSIEFPHARITKRLSVADVYSIGYDVIPMENSDDPVRIQFLGENEL